MSKENIAFVVVRYGLNINGGAEYHCRMLAERLTNDYNVEVLTTCVDNYRTGENLEFKEKEIINKVIVRRFKTNPTHPELENFYKLFSCILHNFICTRKDYCNPYNALSQNCISLNLDTSLYKGSLHRFQHNSRTKTSKKNIWYAHGTPQYCKRRDRAKCSIRLGSDPRKV